MLFLLIQTCLRNIKTMASFPVKPPITVSVAFGPDHLPTFGPGSGIRRGRRRRRGPSGPRRPRPWGEGWGDGMRVIRPPTHHYA